ncbi:hypothetical protein [Mycolicibacterium sp.]|uniref:hypothetical protein n=1 Tax=Mycolicibacterium sp. TaxID=2320850 RepID=UPI001A1E295C|nr:hypothetical protein [Mycolicibacterium sp.]MBJ7336136.1 hypothetical protein [Mycolicibacterium sp.]
MTTHPHHTETNGPAGDRDRYAAEPQHMHVAGDPLTAPTQPTPREEYPTAATAEPHSADRDVESSVEQRRTPDSIQSPTEDSLFASQDVSTEDLRLALKRYREFFDRLLAV